MNLCYLSFYFLLYTLLFFSAITFLLILRSCVFLNFLLRYYPSFILISFRAFLIPHIIFVPFLFHPYLFFLSLQSVLLFYHSTTPLNIFFCVHSLIPASSTTSFLSLILSPIHHSLIHLNIFSCFL